MTKHYKEIKNYIHNEAKIDKDDMLELIRDVIREEVKIATEKKLDKIDGMIENYVQYLVRQGLSDGGHLGSGFKERVSDMLSDAIGGFVANKLDIKLGVEGQEIPLAKGDKHGTFRVRGRRVTFSKGDDAE